MSVRAWGVGYGLLALVAGSTVALGQTGQIRVERKIGAGAWTVLSNTAPGLGNPITVDINQGSPTIPANTNVFIRVYDTDPATLDDIGRVTMAGMMPTGSGRLKVVVWRNTTIDFPSDPFVPISQIGAGSWAGISFDSLQEDADADWLGRKLPQTNIDLLRRTDLAASIRDNLVGSIDVGRVFTLQVNGVLQPDGSVVAGNIDAEVRAYEEDVFAPGAALDDPPVTAAIEYVRAGNRISHGIIASDGRVTNESFDNGTITPGLVVQGPIVPGNGTVLLHDPPYSYVGPLYETKELALARLMASETQGNWLRRGASVRRVVIGPSGQSQGFAGIPSESPFSTVSGVFAPTGRIYRVTTTGPITDGFVVAGLGAYVFRMTDESGSQLIDNISYGNAFGFKNYEAARYFSNGLSSPVDGEVQAQPAFFQTVLPGFTARTGATNLIESRGSITFADGSGSILVGTTRGRWNMANLTGLGTEVPRRNSLGQSGVLSGGLVKGLRVQYNVLYANILGLDVEQVVIGKSLLGAVVAYGNPQGASGRIYAFGLLAGDLLRETGQGGVSTDPYPLLEDGLIGAEVGPQSMAPLVAGEPYNREVWMTAPARDFGPGTASVGTGGAADPNSGGAIDSVIRAENTIDKASVIRRATQARGEIPGFPNYRRTNVGGPATFEYSTNRPRIETPLFDECRIGSIESGVVWSGRLNYAGPGSTDANIDRSDDYAVFNSVKRIYCIGPSADVWAVAAPSGGGDTVPDPMAALFVTGANRSDSPLSAVEGIYSTGTRGAGSVFGELHVPYLRTSEFVAVADGLRTQAEASADLVRSFSVSSTENSPRGRRVIASGITEPSAEPNGVIRVGRRPEAEGSPAVGLEGQVLLRYSDDALLPSSSLSYWGGRVTVGDPANLALPFIELRQGAVSSDDQAPPYGRLSSTLALFDVKDGGSVGVSQTDHHKEDSEPAVARFTSLSTPPAAGEYGYVSSLQWLQEAPVSANPRLRVRFYGPIELSGSSLGRDSGDFGELGVTVESSTTPDFASDVVDVTDKFTSATSGSFDGLRRDLVLNGKCQSSFDTSLFYRVRRSTSEAGVTPVSRLVDRVVPGLADTTLRQQFQREVAEFAHYFKLGARADVAGPGQAIGPDGALTADDIIVFLNWYFANDVRADVAGPGQSFGPDGAFTADDIIVFFNWYFGATNGEVIGPTCAGGEGARPSNEAPISAGRGGETATASARIAAIQALLDAETDSARRTVLQAALSLLQGTSPVPANADR